MIKYALNALALRNLAWQARVIPDGSWKQYARMAKDVRGGFKGKEWLSREMDRRLGVPPGQGEGFLHNVKSYPRSYEENEIRMERTPEGHRNWESFDYGRGEQKLLDSSWDAKLHTRVDTHTHPFIPEDMRAIREERSPGKPSEYQYREEREAWKRGDHFQTAPSGLIRRRGAVPGSGDVAMAEAMLPNTPFNILHYHPSGKVFLGRHRLIKTPEWDADIQHLSLSYHDMSHRSLRGENPYAKAMETEAARRKGGSSHTGSGSGFGAFDDKVRRMTW